MASEYRLEDHVAGAAQSHGGLAGRSIAGWTSLMLVVVVLGAVQMFVLGLMGEYIGRLYNEAKQRPLYIVQEEINFE